MMLTPTIQPLQQQSSVLNDWLRSYECIRYSARTRQELGKNSARTRQELGKNSARTRQELGNYSENNFIGSFWIMEISICANEI